jgi:hypothetical protein
MYWLVNLSDAQSNIAYVGSVVSCLCIVWASDVHINVVARILQYLKLVVHGKGLVFSKHNHAAIIEYCDLD